MLNHKNLVGRCGVYCGACEIYRAYKDKGKLLLEVTKKYNCLPADVHCDGCGVLPMNGWARAAGWGRDCEIRKCLHRRGFEYCYDCNEISACRRWNELAEECQASGIDLRANLLAIRDGHFEEWIEKQSERWSCQKCGKPVHASEESRCHACGAYQL
jgi:hypothetical protein